MVFNAKCAKCSKIYVNKDQSQNVPVTNGNHRRTRIDKILLCHVASLRRYLTAYQKLHNGYTVNYPQVKSVRFNMNIQSKLL